MKRKLTSLNDIAGYEKVKLEAAKLIDLLKNHSKYQHEGAFIPKGLLISGEPGIGKTLLARAIIDQSGLTHYLFDGTKSYDPNKTTRYMKETFEEAKEHTPCILFIDELDQLVSKQGGFMEYKSDATEAFTKLMLTEMDGLMSTDGVFVICTSNDVDRLPDAILRSGRMDKKIMLKAPTAKERKDIIEHYINGKERFNNINVDDLVKITKDFTGADLKTAINEALIEAIHNDMLVTDTLMARKFDEIRFSSIEQSGEEISDRVVYHELGHAIVNHELFDEYTQISVESIGMTEGAVIPVVQMKKEEEPKSFEDNLKQVQVALAGLVSEEVFLGCGSMGAMQDVSKAKEIMFALTKIGYFGFGLLKLESDHFRGYIETSTNDYNTVIGEKLNNLKEKAKEIIIKNKGLIEYIKPSLIKNQRLSPKEFETLVDEYNNKAKSEVTKEIETKIVESDLYEVIKNQIKSQDYCSISYIQRTYCVGFPKAGKIFARLQSEGIISSNVESASKGYRVIK